jgi:hypothetical protein
MPRRNLNKVPIKDFRFNPPRRNLNAADSWFFGKRVEGLIHQGGI